MENKEEIIKKLAEIIIAIESERIYAKKRGNIEKEEFLENKRSEVERIRDKIIVNDVDENILMDVQRILEENRYCKKICKYKTYFGVYC